MEKLKELSRDAGKKLTGKGTIFNPIDKGVGMKYAKGDFPRTQYGGTDFINKETIIPGQVSSPISSISGALPDDKGFIPYDDPTIGDFKLPMPKTPIYKPSLQTTSQLPFDQSLSLSLGEKAPGMLSLPKSSNIPNMAQLTDIMTQYNILKEQHPFMSDEELLELLQTQQLGGR